MNKKQLAQQLKDRFPPNVVQFYVTQGRIDVRPTLKDEVRLVFEDDDVVLADTDKQEMSRFSADDETLVDKIEKDVRKYILS